MKFKLQAGAELDLLTRDELESALQGWVVELARGLKFRNIPSEATASTGDVTIEGPLPGFVWAVTAIGVSNSGGIVAADTFAVYRNDTSPSNLVHRWAGVNTPVFPPGSFVLRGGEALVLDPGTLATPGDVTAVLSVIEAPVQAAWQLL